jgi:hypothetical protein
MSKDINESAGQLATLDWLGGLGYAMLSGLAMAPGELAAERAGYKPVLFFDRLPTKQLSDELRMPGRAAQAAHGEMPSIISADKMKKTE